MEALCSWRLAAGLGLLEDDAKHDHVLAQVTRPTLTPACISLLYTNSCLFAGAPLALTEAEPSACEARLAGVGRRGLYWSDGLLHRQDNAAIVGWSANRTMLLYIYIYKRLYISCYCGVLSCAKWVRVSLSQ